METKIRDFINTDTPDILEINQESVQMLSPMNEKRFHQLRKLSSLLLVCQTPHGIGGFLLGFESNTKYDSTNYQWFDENEEQFLYIDRVAVSSPYRGQGIGKQLYDQAVIWARNKSLISVVAEINIKPRNEESLCFHKMRRFVEIGRRSPESGKIVSLQKLLV
ncbi:MAG: GNAT family N-acetyltransferase [Gammaproteobacteria bacterium]|nr:GNAT family N-acetyltransferase [Gammaproteobacteria bacterium]MCY4219833.1 GNAT family N-acetyltransferase [Gammaproteobacteria bacterium]MCY4275097.1 GNAT family N-acetyltransferase [Gammaproteobacteria bacterium]